MNKIRQQVPAPSNAPLISVALIEDKEGLRESLVVLLDGTNGFRCVGAFANAEIALARIPALAPDVILMDIHLPPGMSGIELVPKIKALLPETRILMLTVFADSRHIFQALKAGASGYLSKKTQPADLLRAIQEVRAGGAPMSGEIAAQVVAYFQNEGPTANLPQLSPRETEILGQLARGYLYKEIADALGVTYDTVHWHIRNIYTKLHVRSRSEAIARYYGHKTGGA